MCQRGAAPAVWLAAVAAVASLTPVTAPAKATNPRRPDLDVTASRTVVSTGAAEPTVPPATRVPSPPDEVLVVTLADGSQMAFVPVTRLSSSIARLDEHGALRIECGHGDDDVFPGRGVTAPVPIAHRGARVPVCE